MSFPSSLIEALITRSRSRGVYVDRAARGVYILRIGVVLGNTLLISNVTGVNNLLGGWAGIDVITTVAEAR